MVSFAAHQADRLSITVVIVNNNIGVQSKLQKVHRFDDVVTDNRRMMESIKMLRTERQTFEILYNKAAKSVEKCRLEKNELILAVSHNLDERSV